MDDLDRLFRYLVDHLARTAPERLQKPFQVSELYQRLVPYRMHRAALGFDSIEDYELAVLRLLAGESGYASVDPPDVQAALAEEVRQVDPNPGAFREFAAATVQLNKEAVRGVVDHDSAYAPPAIRSTPNVVPPVTVEEPVHTPSAPPNDTTVRMPRIESRELVFEPVTTALSCSHCGGALPAGRRAVYCPFCGTQLEAAECRACGSLVEPGWRFCLDCGTAAHHRLGEG